MKKLDGGEENIPNNKEKTLMVLANKRDVDEIEYMEERFLWGRTYGIFCLSLIYGCHKNQCKYH